MEYILQRKSVDCWYDVITTSDETEIHNKVRQLMDTGYSHKSIRLIAEVPMEIHRDITVNIDGLATDWEVTNHKSRDGLKCPECDGPVMQESVKR
ncbi:hypothetical protein [Evansella cellulosilytica]|uniref:Uncharacterized protein n=1 Tax=Evansella cellulosilytica (strain ATCC 21833 / DSM 2522 / FERM P-1141 / JCM 9156 / N-4) TaxID=649639 RepID=E6U1I0_EVAC2|nr:hypothetical protein [Evansella cellulosilytica]ADU30343.1 hypothetical protein Bcell_2082 [Evansella cellulosilytica DSM 2522]